MRIAGHDIGVCSWSLRAADARQLAGLLKDLGLAHVQLALGPLLGRDEPARQRELVTLRDAGITLTAGMISFAGEDYSSIAAIHDTGGFLPDSQWETRRHVAIGAGQLAGAIGLRLVSTHIGFIPPSNHEKYPVMLQRVQEIAAQYAEAGVDLLLETGQEQAATLLQFLNDLAARNVGVNFDPANMILYGAGDPFDAIRMLGRHIRHVHVKDARLSSQPGVTWGEELPFGTGAVGPAQLLETLHNVGYTGPLVIEREAGPDRLADVRMAIKALQTAAAAPE